jgi:hypothetical protein
MFNWRLLSPVCWLETADFERCVRRHKKSAEDGAGPPMCGFHGDPASDRLAGTGPIARGNSMRADGPAEMDLLDSVSK